MTDRTRARRIALQVLYELDFTGEPPGPIHRAHVDERSARTAVRDYAWLLVEGCAAARSELDQLIARHATHWSIERMAPVDRNALRIGAYELLHIPDVPPRVAIDEAVELAKHFGSTESASFVNAILDAVRKERRPDA